MRRTAGKLARGTDTALPRPFVTRLSLTAMARDVFGRDVPDNFRILFRRDPLAEALWEYGEEKGYTAAYAASVEAGAVLPSSPAEDGLPRQS